MSELEGRVVAITGAARGMGRAYVRGFLAEGAKVVAMDRSWEPTGFSGDNDGAFLKELEAAADDVLVATVDISDPGQIGDAYQQTLDKFGTVDVLINNASLRQRNLFPPSGRITTLETNDSDWENMFAVSLFGTLKVTRYFIQPMIEKQRGSVMSVISSGAIHHSHGSAYMALRPDSKEMPYQSAKAAVMCLMFYLADEVKHKNVAVNLLIPGHTRTTGFDEQNAARREMGMTGSTGAGALRPEHIVPLAKFLAQQEANSGVTGKCFDTVTWNIEHGLGGLADWVDPEVAAA
jgi:NAD(P)-dependent dehydrogenase (short-subunit alcohol dehydrogenase family)